MSNKPVKKSDANKMWRHPRIEKPRQMAPEYHLIVTEGKKTEPNYFKKLRQEINAKYPKRISIDVEGIGEGANTLSLLARAEQLCDSAFKNLGIEYKHVWIVYDKDEFLDDSFDNTELRCKDLSNENITYHALWSNECIEYWFLLHFMYLDSALHRSQYFPKLTECLGTKYKKNRDDIYDLLKPNMSTAIKNAKKILSAYGERPPSQCTPGTVVYEIFEKLSSYL